MCISVYQINNFKDRCVALGLLSLGQLVFQLFANPNRPKALNDVFDELVDGASHYTVENASCTQPRGTRCAGLFAGRNHTLRSLPGPALSRTPSLRNFSALGCRNRKATLADTCSG